MWTHLSRQSVGGVGLRGPGETQLESDRRELGKRIAFIKQQLGQVHRHRQLYRERRKEQLVPVVALVGYTNAGKSTLLNALTGAGVLAEDKLFATLDPTTRRVPLGSGRDILLTDTVGFINNLPTMLIAAFRATLEEINEATVIIHVIDITHPNAAEQTETVNRVLEELGADDKPVIAALNKIDQLDTSKTPLEQITERLELPPDVIPISARDALGLDLLLNRVDAIIAQEHAFLSVTLTVPFEHSELVDRFHRLGRVDELVHDEHGTTIRGSLPTALAGTFAPYVTVHGPAQPAVLPAARESAA
jgi:GTP-binding protein HflX